MKSFQLIYCSRRVAKPGGAPWPLHEILVASRANNRRDGITGFLFCDDAWFVQVVEGERSAVTTAYARIGRDPRHAGLVRVSERDVAARSFPEWAMGGAERDPTQSAIWTRHRASAGFDPSRRSAIELLSLAMDLSDFSRATRMKRAS